MESYGLYGLLVLNCILRGFEPERLVYHRNLGGHWKVVLADGLPSSDEMSSRALVAGTAGR